MGRNCIKWGIYKSRVDVVGMRVMLLIKWEEDSVGILECARIYYMDRIK